MSEVNKNIPKACSLEQYKIEYNNTNTKVASNRT